ncbi:hypothetical protein ABPG75_002504 [Micractinium tetrahymenae]
MAELLLPYAENLPSDASKDGGSDGGATQAAQPAVAGLPFTTDLALRRARALLQRPGCGNPRCSDLSGPGEAARRGKRCSIDGRAAVRAAGMGRCSNKPGRVLASSARLF